LDKQWLGLQMRMHHSHKVLVKQTQAGICSQECTKCTTAKLSQDQPIANYWHLKTIQLGKEMVWQNQSGSMIQVDMLRSWQLGRYLWRMKTIQQDMDS
jgi:hypothetical protein